MRRQSSTPPASRRGSRPLLPIGVRAPAAERPHPAGRHVPDPGRRAARPPDPRASGADRAARGRPAAAGRDRGLETRPAPADLPADRADLRPGRRTRSPRTSPTGCPPGPLQRICDDLLEASVPDGFKDASRSLAVDWTDLESFSRPPPARGGRLRRPRSVLGAPQEQPAAQRRRAVLRLLLLRRDHDARGERPGRPRVRPPRHGIVVPPRPGPRAGARADRDARGRDPARRRPDRLRLRPPRRRRLGDPAPPPGRNSSRTSTPTTAAPKAPTKAPSSATATCTARRHPARCWNWGPSPATRPGSRPPRTTPGPPSWPATSSAASPATTPTATTASSALPSWARSAARCGRHR